MGVVSVLFRRPQPTQVLRTIGNSITPLLLDATVKENFTSTAEATQHPVEDGADVTDHVIIRPNGLTISGIITETPFEGLAGLVKAAGASVGSSIGQALGPFGTAVGAVAGGIGAKSIASSIFGSSDRQLGAVSAEFVKLRDAKMPVDIQTGLQLYSSYILTSFTCSRDQKSGGSINVDLEFKELILVESETTQVAIPKVAGALNGSNHGRQSKGNLSTDETAQGSSLLKKILGGG